MSKDWLKSMSPCTETGNALLVPAREAARLCGVGVATWWRLRAAAKVPAPVRLGGRVLWNVNELRAWVEDGCLDRNAWALKRVLNVCRS